MRKGFEMSKIENIALTLLIGIGLSGIVLFWFGCVTGCEDPDRIRDTENFGEDCDQCPEYDRTDQYDLFCAAFADGSIEICTTFCHLDRPKTTIPGEDCMGGEGFCAEGRRTAGGDVFYFCVPKDVGGVR
jgi:hypothetical protein